MGNVAIALRERGWRVSGSDRAFYAPMSDALKSADIELKDGWRADNIDEHIDLVVVGNVCRSDNVEVLAAEALQLARTTLPELVAREFVCGRPTVAVCGTHGKSTTTALLAWMLRDAGLAPGFMVAAIANNFERSVSYGGREGFVVLEADEYDTAFFEKTPKFWHYGATHAIWTSIEFDHADIYRDASSYVEAFRGLQERLPEEGTIVAFAGDPVIRALLKNVPQRVIWYAVEGDAVGDVTPTWLAAPTASHALPMQPSRLSLAPTHPIAMQSFDLFTAGSYCGRLSSPLLGVHNLRNTLASLAMATEVCGAPLRGAIESLSRFAGLKRRQQWLARVDGVEFFDDFAHHPTAVAETLRAFRTSFPDRRLVAVFEPRSATACTNIHQEAYVAALALADQVHLAPLGRTDVADPLDLELVAQTLREREQTAATAHANLKSLEEALVQELRSGDVVVFMSNGEFGEVRNHVVTGAQQKRASKPP